MTWVLQEQEGHCYSVPEYKVFLLYHRKFTIFLGIQIDKYFNEVVSIDHRYGIMSKPYGDYALQKRDNLVKCVKTINNSQLYLFSTLNLLFKVEQCIKDKRDLKELKENCLKAPRLEKSLFTEVEFNGGVPTTSIEKYINYSVRSYNKKHEIKKKNVGFWITFVTENFERVGEAVGEDIKRKGKAVEPTGAVNKVVGEKKSVLKSTGRAVRWYTIQTESILRRDIPLDMNDHISDTLNRILHEVTDYSTGYRIRLMSLILFLNHYAFEEAQRIYIYLYHK
ncbi:hypothetical protein K501DRAFT_271647 [Backusella circina FSU 941]|nr:hypothetical protein K501DRAFT_271647 [Backusella circina FSU 941]